MFENGCHAVAADRIRSYTQDGWLAVEADTTRGAFALPLLSIAAAYIPFAYNDGAAGCVREIGRIKKFHTILRTKLRSHNSANLNTRLSNTISTSSLRFSFRRLGSSAASAATPTRQRRRIRFSTTTQKKRMAATGQRRRRVSSTCEYGDGASISGAADLTTWRRRCRRVLAILGVVICVGDYGGTVASLKQQQQQQQQPLQHRLMQHQLPTANAIELDTRAFFTQKAMMATAQSRTSPTSPNGNHEKRLSGASNTPPINAAISSIHEGGGGGVGEHMKPIVCVLCV